MDYRDENETVVPELPPVVTGPDDQWRSFPSQPPDNVLQLILDAWRGGPIVIDDAVLAAFNVLGFAYKSGFSHTNPTKLVQVLRNEDYSADLAYSAKVEAAFRAVMTDQGGVTVTADDPSKAAFPWAVIIPVVVALLQKWLGFGS